MIFLTEKDAQLFYELSFTIYETVKNNLPELYKVKNELDAELAIVYVQQLTEFYKHVHMFWSESGIDESLQEMDYLLKVTSEVVTKFAHAFSDFVNFEPVISAFTSTEFKFPSWLWLLFIQFKNLYIPLYEKSIEL